MNNIDLRVIEHIQLELDRTVTRDLPANPLRRAALVAEEAGEALKEALDATRGQGVDVGYEVRMYDETVQCAAMALRVLSAMIKEGRCV